MTAAFSGRALDDVSVDAVRAGELGLDDVRISPQTLIAQAEAAEAAGSPELGANLRRAAELALLSDADVLAAYEALRPRRSSADDLEALAVSLGDRGAHRCAAYVREAATVYARRDLLR